MISVFTHSILVCRKYLSIFFLFWLKIRRFFCIASYDPFDLCFMKHCRKRSLKTFFCHASNAIDSLSNSTLIMKEKSLDWKWATVCLLCCRNVYEARASYHILHCIKLFRKNKRVLLESGTNFTYVHLNNILMETIR